MNEEPEFIGSLERQLVAGVDVFQQGHRRRVRLVAAGAAAGLVAAGVVGMAVYGALGPGGAGELVPSDTPPETSVPLTQPSTTTTAPREIVPVLPPVDSSTPELPATTTPTETVPLPAMTTATTPPTTTTPPPCTFTNNVQYPLRRCDEGWAVIVMTQRLGVLGYLEQGDPDGVPPHLRFDDIVEEAVRRFQADHGLEADGLVGPATWRAIEVGPVGADSDGNGVVDPYEVDVDSNAPPCDRDPDGCPPEATNPSCPPFRENDQYPLRRCDYGHGVFYMAIRLRGLGYLPEERMPSVSFDDAVEDAVRRFQADHGLEVDGLVGPLTWQAMDVGASGRDLDENGIVDPYEAEYVDDCHLPDDEC